MFEVPVYTKALIKLLQAGMAAWDALTSEGIGSKEVTAVRLATDALEELRGKGSGQSADMAALHLGVVTQCFGHALGRQWAFNKALAPRGLRLFMNKEQRERADEIELRVKLAVKWLPKFGGALAQPGDLPTSVDEVRRAELLAEPLATPYYRAFWDAFTNPKLDEEGEDRVPLIELDKGRLGFERDFLLAYHQALSSPGGEQLQRYVSELAGGYRTRTLRELLLRDMAGWDERHIFGNRERKDQADDDPIPFMPLGKMYVEPDARLVRHGQHVEPEQRTPVRSLIQQSLLESQSRVVVVRADFGMGKSLTARSLVQQLARQFLEARTPSSNLEVPVYIQCAKDLTEEGFDLDAFARRAWMREASELGIKLNLKDPALAPPADTQPALFLFDGLDEVILGERRLESFFLRIREVASERHRFIIFSRPGALPAEQELEGIPVLELLPWNEQQISSWLGAWGGVSGGVAPTLKELETRKLGELARTPILLFMIAQTWKGQDQGVGKSQAALYEEFFWQIAQGKHEADRTRHKNIYDASSTLQKHLVDKGLVPSGAQAPDAMLWLMGRVAWESTKLEQKQMIEPLRQAEVLTRHGITTLLLQELGLTGNAADVIESIQMGLLLSLQAHLRSGDASQLLFGHKSFREFLVARYWADRLKAIARAPTWDWDLIEAPLLGGRLLSWEDRTFGFLLEMLNGGPHPRRPAAPFGLTEPELRRLLEWAQASFVREEPAVPPSAAHETRGRHPSLREDRRPWLREAALAIGSNLRGSSGMRQQDKLTLRSVLGWFWLMRIGPIILARKAHLEGAIMPDNSIRGADFREARLEGANFSRAILMPGGYSSSSIHPADFSRAVLDRAVLQYAELSMCLLEGTSLQGAQLTAARMSSASLKWAKLNGAVLEHVHAVDAVFDNANLTGAKLAGSFLMKASFVDANLTGASLEGAFLQGADLTGAILHEASLSHAQYDAKTRWPDGFDPVAAGAVRAGS